MRCIISISSGTSAPISTPISSEKPTIRNRAPPSPPHEPFRGPGEGGVERQRADPADQREDRLDDAETQCGAAAESFRQQRAHAHREDHHGEHHGRLGDRVTHQVRGEGDQFQFVDQAAGGADEDGGEHQQPRRARSDRQPAAQLPPPRTTFCSGHGSGRGYGFRHPVNATSPLRHVLSPVRVPQERGAGAGAPGRPAPRTPTPRTPHRTPRTHPAHPHRSSCLTRPPRPREAVQEWAASAVSRTRRALRAPARERVTTSCPSSG